MITRLHALLCLGPTVQVAENCLGGCEDEHFPGRVARMAQPFCMRSGPTVDASLLTAHEKQTKELRERERGIESNLKLVA